MSNFDLETPTTLLYQNELDVFNYLKNIWDNQPLLKETFFYEFQTSLNQALSSDLK